MNVSDIQKAKTPALLGISLVICIWSPLDYQPDFSSSKSKRDCIGGGGV